MKKVKLFESFINEGKNWSKMMAAVRKGAERGPWAIVVIKDRKVIHQESATVRDAIPATFEGVKGQFYPNYSFILIEDNEGTVLYQEKA